MLKDVLLSPLSDGGLRLRECVPGSQLNLINIIQPYLSVLIYNLSICIIIERTICIFNLFLKIYIPLDRLQKRFQSSHRCSLGDFEQE